MAQKTASGVIRKRLEHVLGRPIVNSHPELRRALKRTAFVIRFIILREGRRSRAHRNLETMIWHEDISAEELSKLFREAFAKNGDALQPVDRDIRRALEHAEFSADYFSEQYAGRNFLSFKDALRDYSKSRKLLFEDEDTSQPRSGGWKVVS